MGSSITPDSSSLSLTLTHPTPTERTNTWTLTHPKWGAALSLPSYLSRESYILTLPLPLTQWILTDPSLPPDRRPVLSSCESLRKRALSCTPAGALVEGTAHGICSVFTDPQFRGRGYASRMMRELGVRLASLDDDTPPLFSVLYSDIGKSFYARSGWAPFPSTHLSFPPEPQNGAASPAKPIVSDTDLAALCAADERLLRAALPRRAKHAGRTAVALVPDFDQMLWHLRREDFMTGQIFGRTPGVRGAVYGEEDGKRVWAVWARGYYGGVEDVAQNTLYVLRFVVEDEGAEEEDVARGIRAVLRIAQAEAAEWRLGTVQMWNPGERLKALIKMSGTQFEEVVRETDSIASLMWYGEGATEEVDWFCNEKYGWC